MNHWDLIPHETVTLERDHDGHRLRAGFRFRDTARACFYVENERGEMDALDFRLLADGGLQRLEKHRDRFGSSRAIWRSWRILEKRPNSRGEADAVGVGAR